MRIRMKTHIGGFYNGSEWPAAGTVVEIADHVGADLIAAGHATEETDAAPEHRAPAYFNDPNGGAVTGQDEAAPDGPNETSDDTGDTPADAGEVKKPRRAPAKRN